MQSYSQGKAFLAILKASFRSILSNPSAIFFSLLFPVIFIFIFGSFGGGNGIKYHIAISDYSDTTNQVYLSIKENPLLSIVSFKNFNGVTDTAARRTALEKDKITAIVSIKKDTLMGSSKYTIYDTLTNTSGNSISLPSLRPIQ